ncbi:hypothetical protein E2C01_089732 [Portunus trituberculatus]|uniref:Uncharacterized protein n=1 Tax=Portunus trituberculatus TaxID=210409 RepID=A0A5B7JN84_PORTR|nr:hypothetical protein [Portunus trituberculatus]
MRHRGNKPATELPQFVLTELPHIDSIPLGFVYRNSPAWTEGVGPTVRGVAVVLAEVKGMTRVQNTFDSNKFAVGPMKIWRKF